MAQTYRQKTLECQRALRNARKDERTLDTALEKVERELLRLIKRKTLVGRDSMQTLINLWDAGVRKAYPACEKALADAVSLSAAS